MEVQHPVRKAMKNKSEIAREVHGIGMDNETRCTHYHSDLDIISIRMKCCGTYFACKDCHELLADHSIAVWPETEWDQTAILCGVCGHEMSIAEYMTSGDRCPSCQAGFNPRCRNHYHFYFESVVEI